MLSLKSKSRFPEASGINHNDAENIIKCALQCYDTYFLPLHSNIKKTTCVIMSPRTFVIFVLAPHLSLGRGNKLPLEHLIQPPLDWTEEAKLLVKYFWGCNLHKMRTLLSYYSPSCLLKRINAKRKWLQAKNRRKWDTENFPIAAQGKLFLGNHLFWQESEVNRRKNLHCWT